MGYTLARCRWDIVFLYLFCLILNHLQVALPIQLIKRKNQVQQFRSYLPAGQVAARFNLAILAEHLQDGPLHYSHAEQERALHLEVADGAHGVCVDSIHRFSPGCAADSRRLWRLQFATVLTLSSWELLFSMLGGALLRSYLHYKKMPLLL